MPHPLPLRSPERPSDTFPRLVRTLGILAFSAAASGCALAPGMSLERYRQGPGTVQALLKESLDDAPPPGALTRITLDYVKAQRALRAQQDPTAGLQAFFNAPREYRIGPADVVGVTVWGPMDFAFGGGAMGSGASGAGAPGGGGTGTGGTGGSAAALSASTSTSTFTVDRDGKVFVPHIGEVAVAGLTEAGLRERLTTLLSRYIKSPQVSVSVQAFRSAKIYVDGEVRQPGQKFIDHVPMTLPEAISRAGGFTPGANRSAVLITRNLRTVRVNVDLLTARGVDPSRILLEPGDTVRVANFEDEVVYVMGEVGGLGGRGGVQPLQKGRLTLHQALGQAGGVSNATGDPRQVFVIRPTNLDKPEIFHLDVSNPYALALAEAFELRDRDVVYVDPVPLVRWNRVISLILPAAQSVAVPRQIIDSVR